MFIIKNKFLFEVVWEANEVIFLFEVVWKANEVICKLKIRCIQVIPTSIKTSNILDLVSN